MIYFNKNGETKEIATYESCISNISVSDPSSWGNTFNASSGSLKLTVPSNGTASVRNETVVITYKAGSNNCSKSVGISQEAGTVETLFSFCDGTKTKNEALGNSSTAISYCITSTSGGSNVGYTITNSCSWITTSTTSTGIRMVIAANSGDFRECTFYIDQNGTGKRLTVNVSQEAAAPVETVFTYCDGTTAYSQSFSEGATSFTLCVTSTSGGSLVGYTVASSCDWITASTTSTGVRVTIAANTGAYRQCSFFITQATTNKKLLIAITQSASTASEFHYCDGSRNKTQNTDSEAKNFRLCVVSKIGGEAEQPYSVAGSLPDWITVTTAGTYFNVVLSENTTSSERMNVITLKQNNSTSTITYVITQSATNCNEFLDSCCGKSSYSHPDYDMRVHYELDYQNTDSINYDSTIHVTSTLPSWLGVTINNGIIYYKVLEENTGGYRETIVEYALDSTTGTNVCPIASVIVRQDANPSLLMDCPFNLVNQGSSTASVASIKWTFGNGEVVYTRVGSDVAGGQTIQGTAKFLRTLNNQELFIGHPIDVILYGGTVKRGTINSLLITSGNTYTISFS